jgi:hypothetical protein
MNMIHPVESFSCLHSQCRRERVRVIKRGCLHVYKSREDGRIAVEQSAPTVGAETARSGT